MMRHYWRNIGWEFSEKTGFGRRYRSVSSKTKIKVLFDDGSIKTLTVVSPDTVVYGNPPAPNCLIWDEK